MKHLISILTILLLVTSCESKQESNTIDIDNLIPGPIVHQKLNDEQLEKIKFIYESFKEVYSISYEETLTNFKRDRNPDNEIKIWLQMADAYNKFTIGHSSPKELSSRKEAFSLILMRSMMSEQEAINRIKPEELTKNQIHSIFANYKLEPTPVTIEKKN